jgi:hypothetical protein
MFRERMPENVVIDHYISMKFSFSPNAKYLGARNYAYKIAGQLKLLPQSCIGCNDVKVRCIGFDVKLDISREEVVVTDFREKGAYKRVHYDIYEIALCAGLISK